MRKRFIWLNAAIFTILVHASENNLKENYDTNSVNGQKNIIIELKNKFAMDDVSSNIEHVKKSGDKDPFLLSKMKQKSGIIYENAEKQLYDAESFNCKVWLYCF